MKKRLIKKYKKKRGFTLIELLAVILILGIIALIAIPTVSSVVEQSRSGAAKSSADTFVKAVEQQVISNNLDLDSSNDLTDNTYTVAELLNKGVEVKGTLPDSDGLITILNGLVSEAHLSINGYSVTYSGETNEYVVNKSNGSNESNNNSSYTLYLTGTAIYYNAETNKKCSASDINSSTYKTGTVSGCLRWYSYNDSKDNSKVKMILDHNVVSEYNENGDTEELDNLMINELKSNYISSWSSNAKNSLYMMSIEDMNTILNRTDLKRGVTSTGDVDITLNINGERSWLFEYTYLSTTNSDSDVWGYWLAGYPIDYRDEGDQFTIYDGKLICEQLSTEFGIGIRPSVEIDKSIIK